MVNEAERLELKTKAPLLLANVLFDADVVAQIKSSRALLIRFCDGDSKAQRHLLGGIEQLVAERKGQLMGKMAHIIKALYDSDLCEEETLLSWGEKVGLLMQCVCNLIIVLISAEQEVREQGPRQGDDQSRSASYHLAEGG